MKSKTYLEEFTRFCKKHPDLRFWQALLAWWSTKDPSVHFIVTSEDYSETLDYDKVKDTFNIE